MYFRNIHAYGNLTDQNEKQRYIFGNVFCFKTNFHLINYLAILFTSAHLRAIFVQFHVVTLYEGIPNMTSMQNIWMYGWCVSDDCTEQRLSFSLLTYGDEHSTRTRSVSRRKSLPNSIYRTCFFFFFVPFTRTRTHATVSHFPPFLSFSSSLALVEHIVPGRWLLYTRRRLSPNSD